MSKYLDGLFGLDGKVAVVIGGGGYLCGEMSLALSRAGASVAVLDKNPANARRVADEIKSEGGNAIHMKIDVARKEDHEKALRRVLKDFGRLDILINGAGINAPTPFMKISLKEWRSIIDTHLTGTFLACQVYGSHMTAKKSGSIINMSSVSAYVPLSKAFAYSVAKSGIRNLTQNLAREWAGFCVRVNALRPGFFPTEWSKKHFIDKSRNRAILSHTPMGRYGSPEELVAAVIWLASDSSSFVTGSEIAIDGGFTAMTI